MPTQPSCPAPADAKRRRRGRLSPLLLAGSLSLAVTGTAASTPPGPLAFQGARLGLTEAQWKALPPPAGLDSDARPACAGEPAAVGLRPLKGEPPGALVCGYVSKTDLRPDSLPLFGAFRARNARYVFVSGHLIEVEFTTSADAYVDLSARFKKRYGPPSETIRDSFQSRIGSVERVRQTWRTHGGEIEIVDPTPRLDDLAVRLSESEMTGPGHALAKDSAR